MKYTELDNPHAHLPRPKNREQLESLLSHLTDNINFCSLTHWGKRVQHCLQAKDLEAIKGYYCGKFKIKEIKDLGHQTYFISNINKPIYLYCSQETRTKQGLHITAECCDKLIEENQDARKTIDLIHKQNGRAILEHPFTLEVPLIQFYRFLSYDFDSDKIKLIHEILPMVDGVEVFNSMNTLWQFFANLFAKDLAHSFERRTGIYVPKLVGGDEHYNPIGRVGNLLPKEDLSQATGKEIQEWRWKQYKQGNFKRLERITSPQTFIKYMIMPTITRLFGLEERDFETSTNGKFI